MKNPSSSRRGRFARIYPSRTDCRRTLRPSHSAPVEALEARIAPATFAGTGGPALEIRLETIGEAISIFANGATYTVLQGSAGVDGGQTGGHVSGFGTTTATIDAAAFTTIRITDSAAGTSVTFGASAANAYSSAFDIELDDPSAGGLTFGGASTFNAPLTASVTGSISRTAAVTAQSIGGVSLTSTGGAITLTNAANNFSVVSLATSGTNAIAFRNSATLTLDHVTTESGNLTITNGAGIGQTSTGRIDVGGMATLDITGGTNVALQLGFADNFFGGPVIITESGGDVASINLRNVSPTAALPNLTDLSVGDLISLELVYDGTGITVDATTEDRILAGGALSMKAGGPIAQSAPITVQTLTAMVIGNHGITLTNPGNVVTGDVLLSNPDADGGAASAVAYFENGAVSLGTSALGLGTLTVTAATGDITQAGPITQRLGAGAATFNAVAGSTISLNRTGNLFAGPVHLLGGAVSNVLVRDANTLAAVPDLAGVIDTLTDLTLIFEHAPAVLPSFTALQNLDVNADGIYQLTGSHLAVSGSADFNAKGFKLDLSNAANDFSTLRLRSTGPEDVVVVDVDDVAFGGGNSDIGSGRLTITAGAAITQSGNHIKQAAAAGPATFTAPSIALTGGTNDFTGEVRLNTPGFATLVDTNSIVFGKTTVGGNLSISAGNNITQVAGSTVKVTGTTLLDSGAGANVIAFDNAGNTFTGTIQVADGNVVLRNTGAVTFTGANGVASLNVTAGGAITQAAASSLVVSGAASFDAGAGVINLNLAGNNFTGSVSVSSTAAVTLTDSNAMVLGNARLGGGAFTVNAAGHITQVPSTSITQSAGGALTFLGGAASNVTLDEPGNDFLGPVAVDANSVTLMARGDLTFSGTSDIDGNLTVTAGGTLRLPTTAANLNDLNTVVLSAARTIISTNLTTDAGTGIIIHGAVELASGITINSSASTGSVLFDGDVNPLGSLTFNAGALSVVFVNGTWNQGANNLTINTSGTTAFELGGIAAPPTTFVMSGGTLSLGVTGGGTAMELFPSATFQVGRVAGTAEVVTISTPAVATTVKFDSGSALQVGFGATNDRLALAALIKMEIDGARLIGTGVAGAVPSPVLSIAGSLPLSGTFTDSVSVDGVPQPFLAGSDIVTAGYLPGDVLIGSGGPAPAASFSGFLPDGDKYSVTHTGGAAAGLVVIENAHGQLDIAVRNNTAPGTLNIVTTKFSGDGLTELGGIGVNGPGAITINAGTSNLRGDLRVEGALTALTIRDVFNDATTVQPQAIHAGGAASVLTSITGHQFDGVGIELSGVLNKLKVAAFSSSHPATEPAYITAERFGTLSAVGDAAADIVGNFETRLTNLNTLNSPTALTSLTAANLSGTWDLVGSVGSVIATQSTSDWELGASGPHTIHFHGVTSAGSLSLASASTSALTVTGAITAVKTTALVDVELSAATLGSFTTVADLTKFGFLGQVNGLHLTLTVNQAGVALKTFAIASTLTNSTLHFLDGNVGTFNVARELNGSTISADATAAGGRFASITVGRWSNTDLDAKSVGTLKVIGNATAGDLGDIVNSDFIIRGNLAGLGVGTFSATGEISADNIVVRSGGMTNFTAGRTVINSNVALLDATLGNVKSVSAARWENTDLTARTIGTLKVTGAPQTSPASPLLVGDLSNSALFAFVDGGTAPAIGTLSVAGRFFTDTLTARHGITTLTVGRAFDTSTVVVDDVLAGQLAVGRIGTFTVGQSLGSTVIGATIGKVSATGFITQEGPTPLHFAGLWKDGTILANGATPAGAKSGLDSFSVAGDMVISNVTARSGLGAFSVRGESNNVDLTFDDPLNVAGSGKVGKVSVGDWLNTTIRANALTTLQTIPSAADGVVGDFTNPGNVFLEITIADASGAATDLVALTSFSVAGDLSETDFNIPGGVKTFRVAGIVENSEIAAGFGANARIASLTAGALDFVDLTTRVLSVMNVAGNTPRAIAGNISDSLLTIMGNKTGVGLGTSVAQGAVTNTTFQVTDGNVTSFTVGKFLDSDLLAGFRANSSLDLTRGGVFGATDRTIGTFKTTQAFDATDPDSVSFHNSNVVAADLGALTLSGVDPASDRPIMFGVGFETGGTAGVVKVNLGLGLVAIAAPTGSLEFNYRAL